MSYPVWTTGDRTVKKTDKIQALLYPDYVTGVQYSPTVVTAFDCFPRSMSSMCGALNDGEVWDGSGAALSAGYLLPCTWGMCPLLAFPVLQDD